MAVTYNPHYATLDCGLPSTLIKRAFPAHAQAARQVDAPAPAPSAPWASAAAPSGSASEGHSPTSGGAVRSPSRAFEALPEDLRISVAAEAAPGQQLRTDPPARAGSIVATHSVRSSRVLSSIEFRTLESEN